MDELRSVTDLMASRDIACGILPVNEQDSRDRKLLTEHTRRVSKALRILKHKGHVVGKTHVAGNMVWRGLIR